MDGKDGIYKYQPLWGKWYIELPIGKGSFGSVYKISREDMGKKYSAAVKIISVPSEEQRKEAEASLGNDEASLKLYFEDIVKNIVNEIDMLYALSGNTNIITYQDHEVVNKGNDAGWDILIRMEYVTSLRKYLKEHSMTKGEVIRLGIDICSAIKTYSKKGIVHRDIKDDNIFVNEDGVFKLGDFGIARELSKSGRAASMRGTPLYMAPEVYRGEKYDVKVDIYSLGIVLYKLLNNGRMPFMPPYPEQVRYQDSESALERRIAGKEVPLPSEAQDEIGRIVQKACAFKPEERFGSATEMKKALINAAEQLNTAEKERTVLDVESKTGLGKGDSNKAQETVGIFEQREEKTEGTVGILPEEQNDKERNERTAGIFENQQAQGTSYNNLGQQSQNNTYNYQRNQTNIRPDVKPYKGSVNYFDLAPQN